MSTFNTNDFQEAVARESVFLTKYLGGKGGKVGYVYVNPESIGQIHSTTNSDIWNSKKGRTGENKGQMDTSGKDITFFDSHEQSLRKLRVKIYVSPKLDGKVTINYNLPREVTSLEDAYALLKTLSIYFLIVKNKSTSKIFTLFAATDIPIEDWTIESRRGNRMDRISLHIVPTKIWKTLTRTNLENEILNKIHQ